jgi:hypothetical protein
VNYQLNIQCNNNPDGIENATHNTKLDPDAVKFSFTFSMYCGLHFDSVGLIFTREPPCILVVKVISKYTIATVGVFENFVHGMVSLILKIRPGRSHQFCVPGPVFALPPLLVRLTVVVRSKPGKQP